MTTDDKLRELIALGEKATGKPFRIQASLTDIDYVTAAANLAPEIARELIEARDVLAKANEDAARLAVDWYWEDILGGIAEIKQCHYCGAFVSIETDAEEIHHDYDCPVTLHRARVGGDA